MLVIKRRLSKEKFKEIAGNENMLKLAVDIERKIVSMGCEFHIDCAELLIQDGSDLANVWGANVYPKDNSLDFTAYINIRPEQHNRSMEIQNQEIRKKVEAVIKELLSL